MKKQTLLFLAAIYLAAVCYLLFIGVGHTSRAAYFGKEVPQPQIHWIPFVNLWNNIALVINNEGLRPDLQPYYCFLLFRNVAGNLFLLMPLGWIFAQAFPLQRMWIPVLGAMLLSFAAEALQFLLGIGVADIDDVLLNTAGAGLGVWIAKKW